MSLLNFMEQKAEEKGITVCPNCGTPDTWFSLANKCTECETSLPDKPKTKKLQFSIEVLIEFTQQYDEIMPAEPKRIFVQIGKAIVHKLQTSNAVDNSKLIQLQHLCKLIPTMGSNNFGGAIDGQKMSIQLLETAKNPMTVGKSLGAVLLSIQYIKDYKVENEFILETSPSKPFQREVRQPVSNAPKKNNGCLGTFLMIISAVFLLSLISILFYE